MTRSATSGAGSAAPRPCRNAAHSMVAMPCICSAAPSGHRPPSASTNRRRTSLHAGSESMSTPSRSKTTAAIATGPCLHRPNPQSPPTCAPCGDACAATAELPRPPRYRTGLLDAGDGRLRTKCTELAVIQLETYRTRARNTSPPGDWLNPSATRRSLPAGGLFPPVTRAELREDRGVQLPPRYHGDLALRGRPHRRRAHAMLQDRPLAEHGARPESGQRLVVDFHGHDTVEQQEHRVAGLALLHQRLAFADLADDRLGAASHDGARQLPFQRRLDLADEGGGVGLAPGRVLAEGVAEPVLEIQ